MKPKPITDRSCPSSGVSNRTEELPLVKKEIEAIKAKGGEASNITLIGVGNRRDYQRGHINESLQEIAKETGVNYAPMSRTARDKVHAKSYGELWGNVQKAQIS